MTHRTLALAVTAAAAVALAACRREPATPPPLTDPPARVQAQAERQERLKLLEALDGMTPEQIGDLDALWRRNPYDLDTLEKLLLLYRHDYSGVKNPRQSEIVAARRPYILWLIEHHPGSELAGQWHAKIFATPLDPLPDPDGYAEAKRLWLRHFEQPGVSTTLLRNAARFFEANDKALAEQMMLRAQKQDPNGDWSTELGRLYAFTLMGANASMNFNVIRYASVEDSRGAHAQAVRATLDASTDVELLRTTSQYLKRNAHYFGSQRGTLDFDPEALGDTYLDRASALGPDSFGVRHTVWQRRSAERHDRISEVLEREPLEEAVAGLSEADRFAALPEIAERRRHPTGYPGRSPAEEKAEREHARTSALEVLKLAPKFKGTPEYSLAVYEANMRLSDIAMWDGDKKKAVQYMRDASMVPPSEAIAHATFVTARHPIAYLLKYGERESVIEYMERMAKVNVVEKDYLIRSAAAIRRGEKPGFYSTQIKD